MVGLFSICLLFSAVFKIHCAPCLCHNGTLYCKNTYEFPDLDHGDKLAIWRMHIENNKLSYIPDIYTYPNLTHITICNTTMLSMLKAHRVNITVVIQPCLPLTAASGYQITGSKHLEAVILMSVIILLAVTKAVLSPAAIRSFKLLRVPKSPDVSDETS